MKTTPSIAFVTLIACHVSGPGATDPAPPVPPPRASVSNAHVAGGDDEDEANVAPTINANYVDPDVTKFESRFEREGREVRDKLPEILNVLAAAGLRQGQTVADVGSGTGLYTLELASWVGAEGKVYAVDVVPEFLAHVGQKATKAGVTNIEFVLADPKDAKLPSDEIDVAFMCDVYHHIEYPMTYLETLHRSIKSGGFLFVIDFKRVEGESEEWVLGHVRVGQDAVKKEIESAGFELVATHEILSDNYFLQFQKKR